MLRKIILTLLVLITLAGCRKEKAHDKMEWWREAKFGMFIHWGLYSVPAGEYNGAEVPGIGEWIMSYAKIPVDTYKTYTTLFNPQKFDAESIVLLAKNAGMKYIVITSKHHDGFAMYKSNVSSYNIVDATPFKRDIIAEMSTACKKHDMPFGLYYSQSQDWYHPGGAAMHGQWDEKQKGNYDDYLDKIAVPQVSEILNNYGDIKILWWDTPVDITPERAAKFMPELGKHPMLIYNNRLGGGIDGDLETPEQYIPATGIPGKNWESCMTMNDTWGFKKNDHNWKSTETIVRNLIDIVSNGGNYLLNIGPTNEGLVPTPSINCLSEVGAWMNVNGEAIYETDASPFKNLDWGRCTQKQIDKNTRLYLHIFNMPKNRRLIVPGMANKAKNAYALSNSKTELEFSQTKSSITIDLSLVKETPYATVIALDINGTPEVFDAPVFNALNTVFTEAATFELTTNVKNAVIRYNINDSLLNNSSLEANGVISIVKPESFKVYAACFVDGEQVSGISKMEFIKETPAPPQKKCLVSKGLKYSYFEGKWNLLPDFQKLKSLRTGTMSKVKLLENKANTNYGVTYEGLIEVPETGVYTFYITSDDGSRIIINDNKIVSNDGLHGMEEKSMEVALEKGMHKIRVEFFQAGGGDGIVLKWRIGQKDATEVEGQYFFY